MKKYKAYKDSGIVWIGMIPEGWSIVPLKYYLSLKGRIGWKGLKSDEFEEESYAYLVTGQDFISDTVDWSKCYQINKERYDEDPFIQLDNGDILVTKDGTIGKIAKVNNLDKPACLNSGIFVVKQTKGVFQQSYLYWVLVSNQLKEFVSFNSTGSTIQHLYQNVFENMPLTVPSLSEQQAIADYLDYKVGQIDTSIAYINTQIEDLRAYRQAVISEAVTKGLNPDAPMKDSGIEWIGMIPEGWNIVPLKYYLSLKGRIGWKSNTIQDDDPGYNGAHVIEVVTGDAPKPCLAYLRELGVSYLIADTVSEALDKLKDRFGISLLLLEGGSELNASFLREDLVDEICLVQAPVLAGPKDKPLFACTQMKTAKLLSSEAYEDGTVVMRYEMVREN